jgi:hypothetical protein
MLEKRLNVHILGFSLNFQAFSFILRLLMEAVSFVFCRPLEPIDPWLEDRHEDFLSEFVKNVDDCAFQCLPVRDVIFGEFSLDRTKKEEVIWCEVRAVNRVQYLLDLFCVKAFRGSPCIMRACIAQVDV